MDLDSIKKAIESGNIALLHEFINNEAILKKFVNGDPLAFYEILSSAINVNRRWLSLDDVDKVYDDLILRLIRAAKEVHFGLFNGKTLLIWAVSRRMSYDIIIELLKAGSDVNAATDYMAPLLYAIGAGNKIEVIAELINRGADINCRDQIGWTPLFYVICSPYPHLILPLLNAGLNVHNIDKYGRNMLMLDSCYCLDGRNCKAKESIDMLLKQGINDLDFKHTDNGGYTVLHKTQCKYVFELAIKSCVSIEAKNNKGQTPLLSELKVDKNKKKLLYLLKCGANVNSTDLELNTALHVCMLYNRDLVEPSTLNMLLYHGGNLFARNINNQTPLDIIIATCQFYKYGNGFFTLVDIVTCKPVYLIPKYIILFHDNGFDIARKALENVNNGVNVGSFLSACEKELNVMRETFIKDGLTFYEFCILKRYHKSKCVNIAPNEYKYSFSDISNLFPLYNNIIIIRIKDNRIKKRELDFRRIFEMITFHPVNTTEIYYSEVLNYDCLYRISQYLNFKEMFNIFSAAVES